MPLARICAGLLALLTAATLFLAITVSAADHGGFIGGIWFLAHFFTILTTALILAAMVTIAFGMSVSPSLLIALTVSSVMVGLVYHIALSHLVSLSGFAHLANQSLHTLIPLATLSWWFLFAPKPRLSPTAPIVWISWPLLYTAYYLVRSSRSGFYPYPFLDVPQIGWLIVATNIAFLSVAFAGIGFLLTLVPRMGNRRPAPRTKL